MKDVLKRAFVVSALMGLSVGLAACTDPNGIGSDVYLSGDPSAGADGAAGDPRSAAYFQQTVGDRVLFAVNQSTLTPSGAQTLDLQADWLLQNMDFTAVIEGHADEQGTREYNLALGARRASEARQYLIQRGIAPNRLKVVSFGKERPIAICSDESCYSQNRRAVTVLSAGLSS